MVETPERVTRLIMNLVILCSTVGMTWLMLPQQTRQQIRGRTWSALSKLCALLALDVGKAGMELELAEIEAHQLAYGLAAKLRTTSNHMYERATGAYS